MPILNRDTSFVRHVPPMPMLGGSWRFATASAELRGFLNSGAWRDCAELVKHSAVRSVYRVPAGTWLPIGLYVKVNHALTWCDRLKSLVRPKARVEFAQGRRLAGMGIPVAPVVAWARAGGGSLLVTIEVAQCQGFPTAWARARDNPVARARFLDDLARFLHLLLTKGVNHPDMHVGNILVRPQGAAFEFTLVDLYGVRIGCATTELVGMRLLGWVVGFLPELPRRETIRYLRQCLPTADARTATELLAKLHRHQAAVARRRWFGRRRRLLRDSSLCALESTASGQWHLLRPQSRLDADAALATHLGSIPGTVTVLKKGPKRRVSRVVVHGQSTVVKEFLRPGHWGAWRADCRAWLNVYRLGMHGIPVAACRAWMQATDGRGFLILDDAGSRCLYEELAEAADARARRPWLLAAAHLTARLHRVRIRHGDLKTSNLVATVAGGTPTLVLVDSDSVHFNCRMTPTRRLRNLRQLLETMPSCLAPVERLRFFVAYRREVGLAPGELRTLLARW